MGKAREFNGKIAAINAVRPSRRRIPVCRPRRLRPRETQSRTRAARTHSGGGHMNSEAESGSHAVVVPVDGNLFFDRTKITKDDAFDHVVGRNWEHVFNGVEPLKFTANANTALNGRGARKSKPRSVEKPPAK